MCRRHQAYINASRLNIPASFHQECLHSSTPGGTVFPVSVLQGCAWNETLVSEIYSIIALEARSVGIDVCYGPVINLWTDPRYGRISEGYSSNPTLTAFLARAAVKGMQNDNASGPYTYLPDNKHSMFMLEMTHSVLILCLCIYVQYSDYISL